MYSKSCYSYSERVFVMCAVETSNVAMERTSRELESREQASVKDKALFFSISICHNALVYLAVSQLIKLDILRFLLSGFGLVNTPSNTP